MHNISIALKDCSPPRPPDRAFTEIVATLINRCDRQDPHHAFIRKDDLPAGFNRQQLENRRAELEDAMHPAEENTLRIMVASLFSAFPSFRLSLEETRTTVLLYCAALRRSPPWAVKTACVSFMAGTVAGRASAFVPSSAELAEATARQAAPFARELDQLRMALNIEIWEERTLPERERVIAGFEALSAELKAASRAARPSSAILAVYSDSLRDAELQRAGIRDGRPLSLAFRKQLADWQEQMREAA
jgi:hypothetical protein